MKVDDYAFKRKQTMGLSQISGFGKDFGGYKSSGSQELARIERLTIALNSLAKVDNLMNTFI